MANNKKQDVDYIRAILEKGSFVAAADYLQVSQPAISQFISRLEKENEFVLFNRNVRPISLTEEGRHYYEIELQIDQLRRERQQFFSDLMALEGGTIRIGTNQCRTSTVLAAVLSEFVKLYPKVNIELKEGDVPEMTQRMLIGEVDFCLTLESFLTPQMAFRTLLDEKVLLAIPPDHKVATCKTAHCETVVGYPPIAFSSVANEPFLLLNRGLKCHDYFYVLCDKYEVHPKILLETESITTILELVSKGLGCALVPDSLVQYWPVSPCPSFYSVNHDLPVNRVVAAWNKDRYLSKAAKIFIDQLAEKHRALNSSYSPT